MAKVWVELELPETLNPGLVQGLRFEVLIFAMLMEKELRVNDHKGGWQQAPPMDLLAHACEEMAELLESMRPDATRRDCFVVARHLLRCAQGALDTPSTVLVVGTQETTAEGADLGNMVMMVLDRLGLLVPPRSL